VDSPEVNWPEHIASLEAVRAWIAEALDAEVGSIRLAKAFQRQDWGVTASFTLDVTGANLLDVPPARRVVFKSNNLPQRRDLPGLHDLLVRACPDSVPAVLASRPAQGRDGSVWLLFEHFYGTRVFDIEGEAPGRAAELKTVRTFATIQAAVSEVIESEQVPLPRAPLAGFAAAYERVQRTFRDQLWPTWQRFRYFRGIHYILPDDLPRHLKEHERAIEFCLDELDAGGWPESVDHTDLHQRNAVVQPDGQILIYEWDEATIGCPFFSLDKLLDIIGEPGGLAYPGPAATPPSHDSLARAEAVRTAYIETLTWGSHTALNRALAVALCLAPLQTLAAHLGVDPIAHAVGSTADNSPNEGLIAALLARAFYRWDTLDR
jgi:hypothetical protein